MPTRILIADEALATWRMVVAQRRDWQLVAQVTDGVAAVETAKAECPDVAVLDVQMPRLDAIQAAKQLLAVCPNAAVLAISRDEAEPLVERLQEIGLRSKSAHWKRSLSRPGWNVVQRYGEKNAYQRGAGQDQSSPFAPKCPVVASVCIGFPASL